MTGIPKHDETRTAARQAGRTECRPSRFLVHVSCHMNAQAFEFTPRPNKSSNLIKRSRRADAGYVATEEFRTGQFHVEAKSFQQIHFVVIETIRVASMSIGS